MADVWVFSASRHQRLEPPASKYPAASPIAIPTNPADDRTVAAVPGFNHITEPEPGALYPQSILAEGRTPPEDVGGPPGYEHFLEAINDPNHEDHAEMREWYLKDGFDPIEVDVEAIKAGLKRYARQWTPKAKTK